MSLLLFHRLFHPLATSPKDPLSIAWLRIIGLSPTCPLNDTVMSENPQELLIQRGKFPDDPVSQSGRSVRSTRTHFTWPSTEAAIAILQATSAASFTGRCADVPQSNVIAGEVTKECGGVAEF